jgi:hypothetical protein
MRQGEDTASEAKSLRNRLRVIFGRMWLKGQNQHRPIAAVEPNLLLLSCFSIPRFKVGQNTLAFPMFIHLKTAPEPNRSGDDASVTSDVLEASLTGQKILIIGIDQQESHGFKLVANAPIMVRVGAVF